jgi:hypothetical protein
MTPTASVPSTSAPETRLTAGTGTSIPVERCQVCSGTDLESVLFLGYLPPVNHMRPIGSRPREEAGYPAELLQCRACALVQLGLIVDPSILFPPEYPYTSGTTRILRENFAEMYREVSELYPMKPEHLAVDIGSNDGTLLSNFKNAGHRVCGIEPTLMAKLAQERGIESVMSFFNTGSVAEVKKRFGQARVITATNVFAHIEQPHAVVRGILDLLEPQGIFISESHYLPALIETLQYDTIYHEHLRYYSLTSLKHLLETNGLEIIHAKEIPTHGGSVRVYAARKGVYAVRPSVTALMQREEKMGIRDRALKDFKKRVVASKLELHALLAGIQQRGGRIYGIGAPSRASTLVHYAGLDDGIIESVLEVKGSYKTGKYMPGTLIPVEDETRLFTDPPDYALLFSWHIADELMPKLRAKGFRGGFIIPLPKPRIVND